MVTKIRTIEGQEFSFGKAAAQIPCFRCGLCCVGFLVKLSSTDIRLLSGSLGMSAREFQRRYVKKTLVGPVLRQTGDRCIFLDHENGATSGCGVYAQRPEVCRNWTPTLSRPECLEGLRRKRKGTLLLPMEMYRSREDAAELCGIIAATRSGPRPVPNQ